MSKTDTIDAKKSGFAPSVFPTEDEMAIWRGLTPAEQRAAIMAKVEAGLRGPAATKATKADILAELRAERGA
ncbi:hypothetical protein [Stappia sp.]|uniref:hypothetical protein n=1 Tax=Stappia sp. TaxID=1870903 RepID=UPI003C7DAAEC